MDTNLSHVFVADQDGGWWALGIGPAHGISAVHLEPLTCLACYAAYGVRVDHLDGSACVVPITDGLF